MRRLRARDVHRLVMLGAGHYACEMGRTAVTLRQPRASFGSLTDSGIRDRVLGQHQLTGPGIRDRLEGWESFDLAVGPRWVVLVFVLKTFYRWRVNRFARTVALLHRDLAALGFRLHVERCPTDRYWPDAARPKRRELLRRGIARRRTGQFM